MARASEIREMDDEQLAKHLSDARQELFGLRFRHATGELDNTASLREARRELARALTISRERGGSPSGGEG